MWVFVAAFCGSIHCLANEGSKVDPENTSTSVEVVPLIRVISRPEEFSGQTVTVSGILDSDGRGVYLYLTRDAFEYFDLSLSVKVLLQANQRTTAATLHGEYVVVTATLEYQDWSYPKKVLLKDVSRMEGRPRRE